MYIGELSRLTGASPKAIRLYESMGLIPVPLRKGKYRVYDAADVELIQIIKTAQELGFGLKEMRSLLDATPSCDAFPWEQAVRLISEKRRHLLAEITRLRALEKALHHFEKRLENKNCPTP